MRRDNRNMRRRDSVVVKGTNWGAMCQWQTWTTAVSPVPGTDCRRSNVSATSWL